MSYDLMVFDPAVAPHDRGAFVEWYQAQVESNEGHSYDDPANTTLELRGWYLEIRQTFRNLNGPGAPTAEEFLASAVDDKVADFSIGHHVIYVNFPWSQAEQAYPLVRRLAVKYGVGFYDVSGDEENAEIHFPGEELRPESQGVWRQISRDFKELKKP